VPVRARTRQVRTTVVNDWDVQPTLDRAIACSSGRIVRNRLITAPGPDPASPAAPIHARASTEQAGHPVVVSTVACGGRLGGGPAQDGRFHLARLRPRTDRGYAVTPQLDTLIASAQRRRVPCSAGVRAYHAPARTTVLSVSVFLLKTDSNLLLGPMRSLIRVSTAATPTRQRESPHLSKTGRRGRRQTLSPTN
jgi:hypothetical protein